MGIHSCCGKKGKYLIEYDTGQGSKFARNVMKTSIGQVL
jgi:hypothetical protein